MSPRPVLVFGNSKPRNTATSLSSVRCRMLRSGSPTKSLSTDSTPVRHLRALEQVSPAHAETLGALAVEILRDELRRLGLPPLE